MRIKQAILFGIILDITGCGMISRSCTEAQEVTHEEFGPRAALRKYEWFKDAAASLEKKRANIKVYETRIKQMEEDYIENGKPVSRRKWDRTDKEQFNQWHTELAGVKASYNALASEYNAAMAKINWKFAEVGQLPPGATTPLPRKFKPYVEK